MEKKKNEDLQLASALTRFRKRYPNSTSADIQTFIIGYQTCRADNVGRKIRERSVNTNISV